MDQNKFKKLIAKSLKAKINKIHMKLKMGDLEQWDSLGHLAILNALDKVTKGRSSKIKGLGTAISLEKICQMLKKKKLVK